jgi:alkaline phosphatase D
VASGDPRSNSVVLWTRVVDPERAHDELELQLELALDPQFMETVELDGRASRSALAEARFDHALSIRVDGLLPATHYYYRFSYESSKGRVSTRVGRTKTAPADDDESGVRFAVVCCQDYGGRYFHVFRRLVSEELDFVLHLGDYVYETVGVPPFPAGTRDVTLGRPEDALLLEEGLLAVRSLDNYRDLYRTYRTDPDLQALHERFPIIAIWDDHEFSDDCYGATSTYSDGREDELDLPRRAAADQAWFEYMPVDFSVPPTSGWDTNREFPDNLSIYRSLASVVTSSWCSPICDATDPIISFPRMLCPARSSSARLNSMPSIRASSCHTWRSRASPTGRTKSRCVPTRSSLSSTPRASKAR